MTRIVACLTIDTEPDCDARWKQRVPLEFESFLRGVPLFLRPILDRFEVPPVYLVTPGMLTSVECCRLLKEELVKGAEIGSHLHVARGIASCQEIAKGPRGTYMCSAYPDEIEYRELKDHDENIKKVLGVKATSFRAGRYGADINTITSLSRLGYTVDTSVTPGINWAVKGGPDFSGYPEQPYFVDTENKEFSSASAKRGILEVPVTINGKRAPFLPDKWLFYRWLRPSFMTGLELRALVDDVVGRNGDRGIVVLCMMFHSMELIPGMSPYVRDRLSQKYFFMKLERIFGYMRSLNASFLTLSEICDLMGEGTNP
ncbi:MAG: hypothetical protein HQL30_04955 [Candidatus Omnitrophica bacterium]|nr:hypothetical protein [Candidatus Omnitrophota bacterium]